MNVVNLLPRVISCISVRHARGIALAPAISKPSPITRDAMTFTKRPHLPNDRRTPVNHRAKNIKYQRFNLHKPSSGMTPICTLL
jgi:hypothetical protein